MIGKNIFAYRHSRSKRILWVTGGTRLSMVHRQATLIGMGLSQLIVFRLGAHPPVPLLPQMPTGFSFLLSFAIGDEVWKVDPLPLRKTVR